MHAQFEGPAHVRRGGALAIGCSSLAGVWTNFLHHHSIGNVRSPQPLPDPQYANELCSRFSADPLPNRNCPGEPRRLSLHTLDTEWPTGGRLHWTVDQP